ncbi:MAG: beta-glucosidase BglX [Prevotella sp.]|nr:beta-glucosidase BglX [Prevotella sp.]MDD7190760.1 beta-glucosidase BglX [Prevotella sp.]MDY5313097.1 beta-glucosidase BglX [Prevotella sp.]
MKKTILCFSILMSCLSLHAQKKPMNEFVDDLMAKMTVEEKIGQLNLMPGTDLTTGAKTNSPLVELVEKGMLGAVLNTKGTAKVRALQEVAVKKSRLHIPLIFGLDVIHGYETVLPLPLAQACSWNPQAIEDGARMAAEEATASGICWNYSPMVDVALDARWGRVAEGYGEDPYLSSVMAAAAIRGYQGSGERQGYAKNEFMACLKHYALYGASEAGRDYNTVDMSRLRMYNQYLPPYKAAVEAGVGSVMSSFNIVDGMPATGNRWLITDVLRGQWGFNGFLVTDYGSINEMTNWGFGDQMQSTAQAMNAGTDMDMCSSAFLVQLKACLDNGTVKMAQIDQAVRRVLEAKYKLGLFDDPYRYCDPKREKKELYTAQHRQTARDIAAQTFVLLKNDNDILPLKKQGSIALIGPLADTRNNLPGCWSTGDKPEKYATVKEAMQRYLGDKATVTYAQGSNIYDDSVRQEAVGIGRPIPRGDAKQMLAEALKVAKNADVIVACLGELADMSGESSARSDLTMPDAEARLLKALVRTGKPVVLLNFAGRPTVLSWENDNAAAIMNVWFAGSETGDAICDVLFGDKVPTGKLVNSFPRTTGQEPLYYNHLNTGRPVEDGSKVFRKFQSNYTDVTHGPLYPFGYGLSYTSYSYSPVTLSSSTMKAGGKVTATATITNTGSRDGDEIVQFYIRDRFASIVRPVKELKGFQRIHLAKGESKTVSFDIDAATLSYYDNEGKTVLEPGDFDIMIGANSANVQSAKLTLTK